MNRNYYCKVNSQEEADELLDKLKSIGEPINKLNFILVDWYKIGYDTGTWSLLTQSHISRIKNATEVPASELIDYVTGKKLDKDALLEEAKRRYPVGTKFKSALKGDKHPFQTIVKENIYLDKVDGRQVIWNGDGCGFIYDDENWAEIIEEPKVEVKEKIKSTITWKIGDYVVFVEDWSRSKKGNIDKIEKLGDGVIALYLEKEGLAGSPLHNDCKLKVFPTLQEAQKFSDELLGKSKSSLRVEDLVEGEIYSTGNVVFIAPNKNTKGFRISSKAYVTDNTFVLEEDSLNFATALEKKWLNTCIKQDKFIEQSELNKYDDEGNLMEKNEEYPEYVKLINTGGCIGEAPIINRIYKLVKDNRGNYQYEFLLDNVYKFGFDDRNGEFTKYFEPSTKEAYEAQFKKNEEYKVGDYIITQGYSNNYDGRILQITKIYNDCGWFKVFDGEYYDSSHNFDMNNILRKAFPHEIPVEDSVKQYPLTFEECDKFPHVIDLSFLNASIITTQDWGIYTQITTISETKTTLSIDDEELPMVKPSKEIKVTNKLTID